MGDAPLVSVLIPAHNAHRFLECALGSVQNQTYTNVEILVVDDGSDDGTADLVRTLAADDPRIQLFRQSNQGVAAARNRALAEAQGPYVAPLDADDIWFPRKLEWQVARMQETGPATGLVYAWWAGLGEDGTIVGAAGLPSKGTCTTRSPIAISSATRACPSSAELSSRRSGATTRR